MKKINQKAMALAAKITGATSVFMLFMAFSMNVSAQVPYARLEYENNVTSNEYFVPDPYNDADYVNYQEVTSDVYLRLYADAECSIPYTVPLDSPAVQIQVAENTWVGTRAGASWYSTTPDYVQMWGSTILPGDSQFGYNYYSRPDHKVLHWSYSMLDTSQDFTYIYEVLSDTSSPAKYLPAPTIGIAW